MKKILIAVLFAAISMSAMAQAEMQRLMTTYIESVQLPFYKGCKLSDNRVPKSIESIKLNGVMLTAVYTVDNDDVDSEGNKFSNTYTVNMDLSKSAISMTNEVIEIACEEGIEVTEENGTTGKKNPFLIEKWTIRCNSIPLCNKLLNSIGAIGMLEADPIMVDPAMEDNPNVDAICDVPGRMIQGQVAEPMYSGSEKGMVVVLIRVDASGKVMDAMKHTGTTITSNDVIYEAVQAAKRCVFSAGNSMSAGTITYRFR